MTNASNLLVEAATELNQSPTSIHGRQILLESVNQILSGVTTILNGFDASEIRKIKQASKKFRQQLEKMATFETPAATEKETKEYIDTVQILAQSGFKFCQLAGNRVNELLYEALQIPLKDALKTVVVESPFVVSAAKLGLKNKTHEFQLMLKGLTQRLVNTCLKIEEIIEVKGDELPASMNLGALSLGPTTDKSNAPPLTSNPRFADLVSHDPFTDKDKLQLHMKQFTDASEKSKEYLKQLENMVGLISDSKLREVGQKYIDDIKTNIRRAGDMILREQRNHDDSIANREFENLVAAIDAGMDTLQTAVNRGLVGEIIVALSGLSDINDNKTAVGGIYEAADSKDKDKLHASAAIFGTAHGKLGVIIRGAICLTENLNPGVAEKVRLGYGQLVGQSTGIQIASKVALAAITDKAAIDHLKYSLSAYADAAKSMKADMILHEGLFTTSDLVFGAKSSFEHHGLALREALAKNEKAKAAKSFVALKATMAQLVDISKQEIAFSKDLKYQSDIEERLKTVEELYLNSNKICEELLSTAELVLSGDQKREMNEIMATLYTTLSELGSTIRAQKGGKVEFLSMPHSVAAVANTKKVEQQERDSMTTSTLQPTDEGLRILAKAISDTVFVNEEAPQLLSEEEALKSPLRAAGQELLVEASFWANENNPIVTSVLKLSQELVQLSAYHNSLQTDTSDALAKKSFVQTPQQILASAEGFVKAAQPLLTACTDKRLCDQLQVGLMHINSLSRQLKIVVAVKASSPFDRDSDVQMLTCVRNLSKSLKMALRDAVSCSLRVKKGSGYGLSSALIFKKAVYIKALEA